MSLNHLKYEKLSLMEEHHTDNTLAAQTIEDTQYDEALDKIVAVRNDKPFPISRPPPKARDWGYAVFFMLHFAGILLLSLIEQRSLQHSLLNYSSASSWSSMLMIVTLLGSFFGAVLSFVIGWQQFRDVLLSTCIPFAIILKVCLGNILLIMRSRYSFLGVAVLLSAVVDLFWNKSAREGVNFTSALLQMVVDATRLYGMSFIVTCAAIIAVQSCLLLWWGSFFIGLISTVSAGYAAVLILLMAFSLYWTTQFFHSLMAFIVGGCVLWIFVREDGDKLPPSSKLLLYVQCGLTTSLGSICKGALFTPFAQTALVLNHWVTRRHQSSVQRCSLRGLASCLLPTSLLSSAQRHHQLTLCLAALYGRAFCPTAQSLLVSHPETMDICIEDSTYFLLSNTAVVGAGCVALLFGLVAERGEGASWPLFFFVCYYLAYCGVSLSVQVYSSAVDALIVASAINPMKFAHENQIIFLRFLRTSETQLR